MVAAALLWACVGLVPGQAHAQEAAAFFKQNCSSCHTIGGGRLTGPDLKDVTKQKDRDWLARFIVGPKAVFDSGDAYALDLKKQFGGVEMPTIFGMTRARADSLLDLVEAESKLEKSQFAGVQISERPFVPEDFAHGRDYFLGLRPLAQGGPPCISCHSVNGLGALGGGRLGPDLTKVFERMQGRKQLSAWLSAPATATMLPIYKKHPLEPDEILALVAFFSEKVQEEARDETVAALNFFLLGFGGAIVALVGFDWVWRRRFRSVRRELVHGRVEER
jgi:mono/diheme cytochrome c family protein